ncbi:unnamed protein product, partial [Rotaria sp. Silwood2]
EIRHSFECGARFQDDDYLLTNDEIIEINAQLRSRRANIKLRAFLQVIQRLICSVSIEQFHAQVPYYPQKFAREIGKNHHEIRIKPIERPIDPILLRAAENKFHDYNSEDLNQTLFVRRSDQKNEFPQEIFSSITKQNNDLSEIMNYFKNQLSQSWKKFLSDNEYEEGYCSLKKIIEIL